MAWTSPRTWVPGETVTASLMNTHVRDNLSHLHSSYCERLTTNTTSVGNVGGGYDDLITYSVPANTLSADGMCLKFFAWGSFAANANQKDMRLYFGSSYATVWGGTTNGTEWVVHGWVVRKGATSQHIIGASHQHSTAGDTGCEWTAATETLSGAVTIKLQGQGVATDDIVQEGLIVEVQH